MMLRIPSRAGLPRTTRRFRTAALVAAVVTVVSASLPACIHRIPAGGDSPGGRPPRLIVQITVDMLRADLPLRSRDRWAEGGFRRLYRDGAVFFDAHHRHANTETIVGHATLATGADPSVHGMVGNVWLDRESRSLHYNIEDPHYEVVGNDEQVSGSTADAHGPPGRSGRGRSPEAMLASTIADSIASAGKGRAKVFAVSVKDRGAVPMAGHEGKAMWWSDMSGEFISSTYYYPDRRLPAWAEAWNTAMTAERIHAYNWKLLRDRKTYRFSASDDLPWEVPIPGMTRTFPHRFDRTKLGDDFFPALEASPLADKLLLDFSRALLRGEQLGQDDVVDYLSVSLSATDYIGHRYGPDSLEMEDQVLRVDRVLESLMDAVDEAVGKDRTVFVLSSDHGVVEPPQELQAQHADSGHVILSALEKTPTALRMAKKVVVPFIRRWPPYVYLDNEALRRSGIDPAKAALELAAEIERLPGVEAAFTRGQIEGGKLPDTDAARAVARNFHPERSGDIHVVPKYGWQIAYEVKASSQYATGHGTPWQYDTFVPLVIAGPGVPHGEIQRRVETVDVAPTIAALAGVPAPKSATGRVLAEALRR